MGEGFFPITLFKFLLLFSLLFCGGKRRQQHEAQIPLFVLKQTTFRCQDEIKAAIYASHRFPEEPGSERSMTFVTNKLFLMLKAKLCPNPHRTNPCPAGLSLLREHLAEHQAGQADASGLEKHVRHWENITEGNFCTNSHWCWKHRAVTHQELPWASQLNMSWNDSCLFLVLR